jgi:hypothetical protein
LVELDHGVVDADVAAVTVEERHRDARVLENRPEPNAGQVIRIS